MTPSIAIRDTTVRFTALVKGTIRSYCIVPYFDIVGHGECERCKREVGQTRGMLGEPGGVDCTLVGRGGGPPKGVFLGESESEVGEPLVVRSGCADPG